jgi:hypothetical protein
MKSSRVPRKSGQTRKVEEYRSADILFLCLGGGRAPRVKSCAKGYRVHERAVTLVLVDPEKSKVEFEGTLLAAEETLTIPSLGWFPAPDPTASPSWPKVSGCELKRRYNKLSSLRNVAGCPGRPISPD